MTEFITIACILYEWFIFLKFASTFNTGSVKNRYILRGFFWDLQKLKFVGAKASTFVLGIKCLSICWMME